MRIETLTFFRFLAAIIVVIYHFGQNTELANFSEPFITSGPQMVSFFFTLSGFVMMVSHYNKTNQTLKNYYVARVARIVPLYIFALMIMVYFTYGEGNNNIIALLLSITLMQSWFSPYPLSLNHLGWSVSVEAFFYLSFPLILYIIRRYQIKSIKLVFFSLVFYVLTQAILSTLMIAKFYNGFPSASHDLIYYFPLSHYCSFLLGVTGGYIYVKNAKCFMRPGIFPLIILMSALYVTYFLLQNPTILRDLSGVPLAYGSSFYSLLFIVLILCVAYSNNFITRILSLPILVLLGESSYALYLLQKPVAIAYTKYLSGYFNLSKSHHFYVFLPILIVIAILTFYLIEKPGKKMIFKLNAYISTKYGRAQGQT